MWFKRLRHRIWIRNVIWLGPLRPNHRRTWFGWGRCDQTTGARDLVGAVATKPQTHVVWLGPLRPNHRRTWFGWGRCDRAPKALGSNSKPHLEYRCCWQASLNAIMCGWLTTTLTTARGCWHLKDRAHGFNCLSGQPLGYRGYHCPHCFHCFHCFHCLELCGAVAALACSGYYGNTGRGKAERRELLLPEKSIINITGFGFQMLDSRRVCTRYIYAGCETGVYPLYICWMRDGCVPVIYMLDARRVCTRYIYMLDSRRVCTQHPRGRLGCKKIKYISQITLVGAIGERGAVLPVLGCGCGCGRGCGRCVRGWRCVPGFPWFHDLATGCPWFWLWLGVGRQCTLA